MDAEQVVITARSAASRKGVFLGAIDDRLGSEEVRVRQPPAHLPEGFASVRFVCVRGWVRGLTCIRCTNAFSLARACAMTDR